MTDDWRDVPMAEIDWRALKVRLGRPGNILWRLCRAPNGTPTERGYGSWHEMTLGQVADLGAREIRRHLDVGEATVVALQAVIDMAAGGTLPMGAGDGRPASDALRPAPPMTGSAAGGGDGGAR